MAAVRTDFENISLMIEMIAVKVPLMLEPNTTAPVYLKGSFAAIP